MSYMINIAFKDPTKSDLAYFWSKEVSIKLMSIDINYKMILKESILTFTKVLKFISLFYDFILFYQQQPLVS